MKSRYVWIDGTWIKGFDGRPRVVLFGRDYDDPMKTQTIAVKGFNPYFYVNINAEVPKLPEIQSVGGPYTDALGRKVKKIIVNLPSDVPKVRKHFEWTDEADILFDVRFVVDAGIKYAFDDEVRPVEVDKPLQPRIMYLDIEVRSPEEVMAKPEKPEWPIVAIQTLDSYTGELKVFALDVPSQADDAVVSCQTERELLLRFADYVQRVDPDVLTGWFSSGFDLPYLINRARILAVPLDKLTRLPGRSYPRANQLRAGGWTVRIVGRQCVDMLEAFKKWHKAKGELETYDLKFVAKKFAGFEYEDYGDSIDRLYREQDWETLIDYCKNDVLALRAIDQAIGLFEFYEYIRFVVGCKLEDTMKNSKIIEMLLMRAGIKPMPTRRYDRIDEEDRYTGALVLQPPLGVHEWVGVFDLASLYPSIIMAFDVSPDVDKMIPKVITTVLQERERLRKLRLEGKADEVTKMKEVVLKFLANSFYGVLGWSGFRLYSREHAEFITTKGREINMFLQRCAREKGYTAIYGDTDSIFVKGVKTPEQGLELQDYFNERLQEWAQNVDAKIPPRIKFEKLFRRIMFKRKIGSEEAAKKRYAGWLIWEDGHEVDEIKIVGMETRRSDVAEITKELMGRFLELVLKQGDIDAAGRLIRKTLRTFDRLPLQKVAIPKGVTRDLEDYKSESAWIVGIRNAQQLLGLRFRQDRKPRLLYLKRPVKRLCITEDVEKLPDDFEVDWEMMKEKTIVHKFKPLIEALGLSWEVVVEGQTTLDSWW